MSSHDDTFNHIIPDFNCIICSKNDAIDFGNGVHTPFLPSVQSAQEQKLLRVAVPSYEEYLLHPQLLILFSPTLGSIPSDIIGSKTRNKTDCTNYSEQPVVNDYSFFILRPYFYSPYVLSFEDTFKCHVVLLKHKHKSNNIEYS